MTDTGMISYRLCALSLCFILLGCRATQKAILHKGSGDPAADVVALRYFVMHEASESARWKVPYSSIYIDAEPDLEQRLVLEFANAPFRVARAEDLRPGWAGVKGKLIRVNWIVADKSDKSIQWLSKRKGVELDAYVEIGVSEGSRWLGTTIVGLKRPDAVWVPVLITPGTTP
jgi:hypothetical protein